MGSVSHATALPGRDGLLRPLSILRAHRDERLVAQLRAGNERAFDVLYDRYRARILAFCRGMLRSHQDAEDVAQEVFTAAHAALLADEREIEVRPWLYRIARNRCLNHMRRPHPECSEALDERPDANGASAEERFQRHADLRDLVANIRDLPEAQRSALLMRELEALSYREIAASLETTVPAVKSLLVRARVTLTEASQGSELTCEEVRFELAAAAEGVAKVRGPARHHIRRCPECTAYRRHLRSTTRKLAGLAPLGPLLLFKRFLGAKLAGSGGGGGGTGGAGLAGGSGAGASGAIGGAGAAGGGAATVAAGAGVAGGAGLAGSKLAAGAAVAAALGAGGAITNGVDEPLPPAPAIAAAAAGEDETPARLPMPAPSDHGASPERTAPPEPTPATDPAPVTEPVTGAAAPPAAAAGLTEAELARLARWFERDRDAARAWWRELRDLHGFSGGATGSPHPPWRPPAPDATPPDDPPGPPPPPEPEPEPAAEPDPEPEPEPQPEPAEDDTDSQEPAAGA